MEDTDLTEEMNWTEAAVKGRTKREIYRILQMKGKFYLPPESQTNSDFIHDIMVGKIRVSIRNVLHWLGVKNAWCYNDPRSSHTRLESFSGYQHGQEALKDRSIPSGVKRW